MSDEQTNDSALILPPPQSVTWRSVALVRRGLESASGLLRKDSLLLDETPLSIGFEDENGLMKTVIPIGTIIPCRALADIKVPRCPSGDYSLDILQGIRANARTNHILGTVHFMPGQASSLSVRIQFSIDSNGILNLSASDITTGNPLTINLVASQGLSKAQIDQHKNNPPKNYGKAD